MRLTNRNIDRLKPTNQLTDHRDPSYRNLVLRVTTKGTKTFYLIYTSPVTSKRTTFKLGRWTGEGSLTPLLKLYRSAYTAVHIGEDPAVEKRAEKAEEKTLPTIRECGEDYVEYMRLNRAEGTSKQARMYFNKYVFPALGERAVDSISRKDVLKFLDDLQKGGMTTGVNGVFSHLRSFFNRLEEREVIEHSPCARLKKPVKERKSSRYLEESEIRQFLAVLQQADIYQESKNALLLYLLTGARRNEVGNMTWQEISFDDRVWRLPAERSKSRRARTIPLSEQALAVLRDQRSLGSFTRVFSVTSDTYSRQLTETCKESMGGLPPFTIHSLRHTVISHLARLKTSREVIQALVGHTYSDPTSTYLHYDYLQEMREAVDRLGEYISELGASSEATGT